MYPQNVTIYSNIVTLQIPGTPALSLGLQSVLSSFDQIGPFQIKHGHY